MDKFNNDIINTVSGETDIHKSPSDTDVVTGGCTLIMYNDEIHSFEEVIFQVMKATGYSSDKSAAITFEAHQKGKAVVMTADLSKCVKSQLVLEEIGLSTSLEVNS